MAIHLDAAQLKQAQENLKRNYPRGQGNTQKAPPTPRVSVRGRYKAVRQRPATKTALGGTRKAYGRVSRTKPYKAGAGGLAAILVLLIGMGITIAVIRKPALVTAPLSFIGDITSATNKLTSIGQKKAV